MIRKDDIPRVYRLHSVIGPAIKGERQVICPVHVAHPEVLLESDSGKGCVKADSTEHISTCSTLTAISILQVPD